MTQFANPILAKDTLVREAIKSPNFLTGVSGWSIDRDGTAEFQDITVRGDVEATSVNAESSNFVTGTAGWKISSDGTIELNDLIARGTLESSNFVTGQTGWRIENTGAAEFNDADLRGDLTVGDPADTHIDITKDGVLPNLGSSNIRFHSGMTNEIEPAHIENQYSGQNSDRSHFFMRGADVQSGHGHPIIDMHTGSKDGSMSHDIQLATFGGTHPAGAYLICALTNILLSKTNCHIAANIFTFQNPLGDSETTVDFLTSNNMRPQFDFNATSESVNNTNYTAEANAVEAVFIAPPSGTVTVELNAQLDSNASVNSRFTFLSYEVREGGSVGSGNVVVQPDDDRAIALGGNNVRVIGTQYIMRPVTGLTPGDTYNLQTFNRVNNSSNYNAAVSRRQLVVRPEM